MHCIETHGRHVQYLKFLQTIVKAENQFIRKCQDLVMQEVCSLVFIRWYLIWFFFLLYYFIFISFFIHEYVIFIKYAPSYRLLIVLSKYKLFFFGVSFINFDL